MPLGRHGREDGGLGAIQIDQNVTGVLVLGIRMNVDVATLAIPRPQKPDGGETQQLLGGPQPFSGKGRFGGLVNQTNEIQLVRHRRELAADSLGSKHESTIEHAILLPGTLPRRRAMARQGVRLDFCLCRGYPGPGVKREGALEAFAQACGRDRTDV